MTSDRIMQAIGRIERAITRLETVTGRGRDLSARQADEISRLDAALHAAETRNAVLQATLEHEREEAAADRNAALAHADRDSPAMAAHANDPHAMNPFSHDKALAALRSLDSLIDDLQKARRDG